MRHLFLWLAILCMLLRADGASVRIRNVSFPHTALEVGNTVEVRIADATPFGTVTVIQGGAPPFIFGTTDGAGNWSTTQQETAEYVGTYNQTWYVNGIEIPPDNSHTLSAHAPSLPVFQVFARYIGQNTLSPRDPGVSCNGSTFAALRWTYKPLTWRNNSSISSQELSSAIQTWTNAQSIMTFSPYDDVRQDIKFLIQRPVLRTSLLPLLYLAPTARPIAFTR